MAVDLRVRAAAQVPIIAASGLATAARAAAAASGGVMYFLPKPYTPDTLLTAIGAALHPASGKESEN